MRPYSYHSSAFSGNLPLVETATQDLAKVREFIKKLPEPTFHPEVPSQFVSGLSPSNSTPYWTCHALARAALKCLNLKVKWKVEDGLFISNQQHSWLELDVPEQSRLLLDVYPVASFSGATLLDVSSSIWRKAYIPRPYSAEDTQVFNQEGDIAAAAYTSILQPA